MTQKLSTVVIVTDAAHATGGAERVALDSAIGLAEAGFKVIVFAGAGDPQLPYSEHKGVQFVNGAGTHVKDLNGFREKLGTALWNEATHARMTELLRTLDPKNTIIHGHSYLNVCTPSIFHAISAEGFAYVITGHDYGLACPTLGFYDARLQCVCPLKAHSLACYLSPCTGTSRVNKLGFVQRSRNLRGRAGIVRNLKHLIAVSKGSGEILKPYLPGTQIHIIRNPIDIQKPSERVRVEENSRFGYMARLTPEKDPVFFASACKQANIPCTVLGNGPEFESTRSENPECELPGHLDRAGVDSALSKMRCLVMTSRWYEGAPLVINEAHARGIPVILPSICAGRDAVQHGETGFIYESGNQSDLIACMNRLQDDNLCRVMGETAFERFWSNPQTMESSVRELIEVYEVALTQTR